MSGSSAAKIQPRLRSSPTRNKLISMTKFALSVALILGSVPSVFAKPAPATVQSKVADTKKDVVLEINGWIYPKDTLPPACGEMLKGVKCAVDSFGKYHVESKKEGELIHNSAVFSAPEGPQVIEDSWEKNGRVQKARIENRALGKISELEVRDGKVFYKMTQADGTVKTSDDDYEENLVVPSTVMSYIRPFNDKLLAGEEVKLKVAVMDRRESFTFYMKKYKMEKGPHGEDILVLKMSPGSIIVRALVDPMYFYTNPKTGEMFAFEGRSALRRKEGDKYKELDVRAAYEYKINTFNPLNKTTAKNDAFTTENCSSGMVLGKEAKCEVKSQ